MTESLEDLLRRARASGVSAITMDRPIGGVTRAGAWKAFSHFGTGYNEDPAAALKEALLKAIAPPRNKTDLSNLLD